MENKFSHLDASGKAKMVDVGHKDMQKRTAVAKGFIMLQAETCKLIKEQLIKKGDVLTIAEIAGIQAAKQTASLIPLCHNLLLTQVKVNCTLEEDGISAMAEARCNGQTGVEMEALTAVSVALLTVYDMCKAVDKEMVISNIKLIEKIKTHI